MASPAAAIFTAHAPYLVPQAAARAGRLAGLTASVKDLYDVAGLRSACGSRAWLAAHPEPAAQDSAPVARLRAAGAALVGKTQQDEMAWSLTGENGHYGAPPNPAAPGCITGGSSSGAAASVAAGLCDIALASDTAGSIRVPASHCGLFGMRPTHGRVPMSGACPLAPEFDTAGILARTLPHLRDAMSVLLDDAPAPAATGEPRWLCSEALFSLVDDVSARAGIERAVLSACEPQFVGVGDLDAAVDAFITLQTSNVWQTHGDWVRSDRPQFDTEGVAQRFAAAEKLTDEEVRVAAQAAERISAAFTDLLGSDGFLVLPAAPGRPPQCSAAGPAWRRGVLRLTALAALCGCPQVVVPAVVAPIGPLGIGIIGPRGSDERLLELASKFV